MAATPYSRLLADLAGRVLWPAIGRYRTSAPNWDSTTGQGTNQCFSVMVTSTVCPTMR